MEHRTIRISGDKPGIEVVGPRQTEFGNPAGVWARWRFDGQEFAAETCPIGFYPLYWRSDTKETIALSESPLALAGDSPKFDWPALSAFVRLGFFLGEDTPFLGVKRVPANAKLTWSIEAGPRLHVAPSAPPGPCSSESRVLRQSYAALFRQAVARTLPLPSDRPLYVPLSGGRDSRHIALALHEMGIHPNAYVTFEQPPWRSAEDVRVAAQFAKRLRARHLVFRRPWFIVRDYLRCFADTGFCSDEYGPHRRLFSWLNRRHASVYDGIGGDVMSAGLFQSRILHEHFCSGRLSVVANELLDHWQRTTGGWEGLVEHDVALALRREVAHNRLLEELEKYTNHRNPVRSFYFWNRTRREIALGLSLQRNCHVLTPYLETELLHFLDSLPFDIVEDHTFHTKTILEAYPEHAGCPFEDKEATPVRQPLSKLFFGASCMRVAALSRSRGMRRGPLVRWGLSNFRWWTQGFAMVLYLARLLEVSDELSVGQGVCEVRV